MACLLYNQQQKSHACFPKNATLEKLWYRLPIALNKVKAHQIVENSLSFSSLDDKNWSVPYIICVTFLANRHS